MRLSLGILDVSPTGGGSGVAALRHTLAHARQAEALGYARYWLAEHHSEAVAHSTPEIALPWIPASTSRIRLGAAGILLRLHNPLRVVEQFRTIAAIAGNRVDLGIAAGSIEEDMLGEYSGAATTTESYQNKVRRLADHLKGEGGIAISPTDAAPPELWILGTGGASTDLAANIGANFCLGLFFNRSRSTESDAATISRFRDLARTTAPSSRVAIAFAGICARTQAEADSIAQIPRGDCYVENFVGTANSLVKMICTMSRDLGVSDFIFLNLCEDPNARLDGYSLLATAAGLSRI